MDVKVNVDINPEDIQRQIVDSIAKSAIGEQLTKAVEAEVKKLQGYDYQYQKLLQNIVSCEIERTLRRIVDEEYKEAIQKVVREKVSEEFTQDLVDKMWEAWKDRY